VKVFLVRHAHAVDEDARLSDADRFLSVRGRETARRVAERLKEAGVTFDALLTSPLVRAVQTAELLAAVLAPGELVAAWPALAPGGSLRAPRTSSLRAARRWRASGTSRASRRCVRCSRSAPRSRRSVPVK
jgi:phosphohistidine phosphatase